MDYQWLPWFSDASLENTDFRYESLEFGEFHSYVGAEIIYNKKEALVKIYFLWLLVLALILPVVQLKFVNRLSARQLHNPISSSNCHGKSTSGSDTTTTPSLPTTQIPVTWSDLNLTGKLVYISALQGTNDPIFNINTLDLATGTITTIFQAPEVAWIYYMSVSPDGKQAIISYSTPPQNHEAVNQDLYILPLDGSSPPQLLITPPTSYDQYLQAEWSPDGKYIYYVHNNYKDQPAGQHYPDYEIYRMAYPDGQPQKILDQAFWPRLSPDGSRLVYISINLADGTNNIFLANADGSNAQQIQFSGAIAPNIIDAPIFAPDGQSIIFSALSPTQIFRAKLGGKIVWSSGC